MERNIGDSGVGKIPEERREAFTRDLMKLFRHGGMMQFETVRLYEHELFLIKPVELDRSGYAEFHYNYFEDDIWERVEYDANKAELTSGAVGEVQFKEVMEAAYSLYEDCGEGAENTLKLPQDDRAFWWNATGDVKFSQGMKGWLQSLSERYREILNKTIFVKYNNENTLEALVGALAEADSIYKRIYAFRSMFYEFLQHGADEHYMAAIELFGQLCRENEEDGRIIESEYHWEGLAQHVKCNAGRMRIKRYLAVMANRELRQRYFGF